MKYSTCSLVILILCAVIAGCSPMGGMPAESLAPTPTSSPAATLLPVPTMTTTQQAFPLSAPGPHPVGMRILTLSAAFRENRSIDITLWYPRVNRPGEDPLRLIPNADPDPVGSPYPLILGSRRSGLDFGQHLAGFGFVFLGLNEQSSADAWGTWLIEYPRMILFALDQIAQEVPPGMEGIIDSEHAGAAGYSFDGYNALALSGARIDPDYYLNRCGSISSMNPPPEAWWVNYICAPAGDWPAFSAIAGPVLTSSEDGLWQPMTDKRIRAVMPMAPEGAWLFGERGLAAVDRPVLILHGTGDVLNYYQLEAVPIFERIGTTEKAMISFRGQGHFMITKPEEVQRMRHFAVAFFTRWLKEDHEYDQYLAPDFIQQFDDLVWGVYSP